MVAVIFEMSDDIVQPLAKHRDIVLTTLLLR